MCIVTRSRSRLCKQFKIKPCFVGLDISLIAESLQYLEQNISEPAKIAHRRATTAAAELFCINNTIVESSADFFEPVDRSTSIPSIPSIGIKNNFDPFKRLANIPFAIGGRKRAISTSAAFSPFS